MPIEMTSDLMICFFHYLSAVLAPKQIASSLPTVVVNHIGNRYGEKGRGIFARGLFLCFILLFRIFLCFILLFRALWQSKTSSIS